MMRKLVIVTSLGLALTATGCSSFLQGNNGGDSEPMGGRATIDVDPAGSATLGTGSTGVSGEDRRIQNSTGMGMDG